MKKFIVPKYLLDTNMIIESFLGRQPAATLVKNWIKKGEIAISAIVVAEILSKASQIEGEKLKLLTSRFGVLPIDETVAEIAGRYRQQFLAKKKRVYLLDCLIAATAKLYNLQLVTHNIKDYPMKDIKILKPNRANS
jgi:predicted nucleic acid-binding protein